MYARDCYNNAPIHRAVSQGYVDIMNCLIIDCACDQKIKGYQGRTLLHFSCAIGNASLVNMLIKKYGIKPMATDAVNQTPLHIAASHGQDGIVCLLITKYNCRIDSRDNYELSPLHLASYCGRVSVVRALVLEHKADMSVFDVEGGTPFLRAVMGGSLDLVQMMIVDFNVDLLSVDVCGNTPLHMACIFGHEELARLLITKYNCPVNVKDKEKKTPLHQACYVGYINVARMLISEFKANINSRNYQNSTPLGAAVLGGHTDMMLMLITEFDCSPQVKGFEGRSLLHYACEKGHNNLAMILITDYKLDPLSADDSGNTPLHCACLGGHEELARLLINKYNCPVDAKNKKRETPLHWACSLDCGRNVLTAMILIEGSPSLIHFTDDDGYSPLHWSSHCGQAECVRLLLFDYHAPIFIRTKAGKTALDLAKNASIKKIFKDYMSSKYKGIQQEYKKLQSLSLKKYASHQSITRIFVLGHPGSGKSTLVESLQRKGLISSRLLVTEDDVPPHTAGIVPSTYQSKEVGQLLYYDFAGDHEYYSSHAAVLEVVSHSTVGSNVYIVVAKLKKDGMTLCNEIGYWLSFISFHAKVSDDKHRFKVVVVLSHSDCLSVAESTSKHESIKQYLQNQKEHCNKQKLNVIDVLSSDCRRPRSSQIIENTLQQISRDTPPYSISFETTLLHGMLQKHFRNVVACKFQDLLSHIRDTGICLPAIAKALFPLVKELHDIGALMMIKQKDDQLEDCLLLLNPSSLTNEVHQRLFSDSARQTFTSSVSPYYAKMGILPESCLGSI